MKEKEPLYTVDGNKQRRYYGKYYENSSKKIEKKTTTGISNPTPGYMSSCTKSSVF
jgi:hypothetical protein